MGKKRRYYREDRRRPAWEEEEDEWEQEEEDEEFVEKRISTISWWLIAILASTIILSTAQSYFVPPGLGAEKGYRVLSVSQGKLHTEEVGTGKQVSFDDQGLVRAALEGSIKRGDVIHR